MDYDGWVNNDAGIVTFKGATDRRRSTRSVTSRSKAARSTRGIPLVRAFRALCGTTWRRSMVRWLRTATATTAAATSTAAADTGPNAGGDAGANRHAVADCDAFANGVSDARAHGQSAADANTRALAAAILSRHAFRAEARGVASPSPSPSRARPRASSRE